MPSEAILLRDFLLSRAPLTEVLGFEQFTELFPRSTRTHPQVALLYRELEHRRAVVLDEVAANIAGEAKRGEKLMRQLAASKARRRRDDVAKRGVDERDVDMEVQVRVYTYRYLRSLFCLGLCLVMLANTTTMPELLSMEPLAVCLLTYAAFTLQSYTGPSPILPPPNRIP